MRARRTRATFAALAGVVMLAAFALPESGSAVAPNPNPWSGKRFLNIAHQGGEDEAPSNTLFAFKSALRARGADMLELDVNLTSDGELVVIHDDTVNRTTEVTALRSSGDSEVNDLTLAEVQALDAGYSFRPGHYDKTEPPSSYPYRGIANGAPAPPPGYVADDFQIPTLRQVLDAFPNVPINIEIKMIKTPTGAGAGCVTQGITIYCDDPLGSIPVADALAAVLDEPQYASRDDIIVVSFSDMLVERFHDMDSPANGLVALAPGIDDIVTYGFGGVTPDPDVAAFQVPPVYQGFEAAKIILEPRPPFRRGAREEGYAVHVWTNGDQDETEASYQRLYDMGADGIMSSVPGRLAAWLCSQAIPRPNGSSRGPGCEKPTTTFHASAPSSPKKCKKGKKLKGGKCVKKKRKKRKPRR